MELNHRSGENKNRICITSLSEYKELIQTEKKKYGKLLNNAYYYVKALEEPISQGRLTYQEIVGGIVFFLDKDTHENVYFFINEDFVKENVGIEKKKPLVVNLITNINVENAMIPITDEQLFSCFDDKVQSAVHFLNSNEFSVEDAYLHMQLKKGDFHNAVDTIIGYQVKAASLEMIDDILKILSDTFSGLTSELPQREDLVRLINAKESFVLLSDENDLCGYIQCEKSNATMLLRHIVISKKHRGKGLGDFLVRSILGNSVDYDSVLWVKNDNFTAYNLYKKYGYDFDGRVMVNYVK